MDCTASTKALYAGNLPLPSFTNNINENIQIKNEAVLFSKSRSIHVGINSKLSAKTVRTQKDSNPWLP